MAKTPQLFEFAVVVDDIEQAVRDLRAAGIVISRPTTAAFTARGTEDQIRRFEAMGYEVDCWELNDQL
jgi:hypothetical protein